MGHAGPSPGGPPTFSPKPSNQLRGRNVVNGDFFRVLGVQPWIGRTFTADAKLLFGLKPDDAATFAAAAVLLGVAAAAAAYVPARRASGMDPMDALRME